MTPAAPQVPRAVALLAVIGLAIVGNRYSPGILQAVLALVVLYVALTHSDRVLGLVGQGPSSLARAFHPEPDHSGPGWTPTKGK